MLSICIKDIKIFFIDKKAVMLTFLVPITLITLFAFAFGGIGAKQKSKPIYLPITDLDNSSTSINTINQLDSLSSIRIDKMSLDDAVEKIKKGKIVGVLIFHEGYEDSMGNSGDMPIELLYDQAREIEIGILRSVLAGNLYKFQGKSQVNDMISEHILETYKGVSPGMLDTIMTNIGSFYNKQNGPEGSAPKMGSSLTLTPIISESDDRNLGLIQAVAGTAIMMLLFSVSSVGAGILVEKDAGTLKRLLYSPISPVHILYGKMLAGNIIAVTQLSVMFLFSWIAFGLNIWIDIPSMMVMIMSTAFACTSFGIFLASISQTEKQVDSLATIVILVMSGIGGSMIPLFVMPEIMQKIAVVSMNYWGIQGFYDIFWRQLPFSDVMIRAGVLFSIGFIMTAISTYFYQRNILRLI